MDYNSNIIVSTKVISLKQKRIAHTLIACLFLHFSAHEERILIATIVDIKMNFLHLKNNF